MLLKLRLHKTFKQSSEIVESTTIEAKWKPFTQTENLYLNLTCKLCVNFKNIIQIHQKQINQIVIKTKIFY